MKIGRAFAAAGALTALGVLVAPGLAFAHDARAVCFQGDALFTAGLYPASGNFYVADGQGEVPFSFGFSLTLPGDKPHTVVVHSGDNWPTATLTTEKCREPETTTTSTTVPETTTTTTVPETTTTTTVPETTTTVPETTTTVPETTVPDTTVPETTVPVTTVPEETTTVPEETTTTVPEVVVPPAEGQPPAPPAEQAPPATSTRGALPKTASNETPFAIAGAAAFAGGAALLLVARRRKPVN